MADGSTFPYRRALRCGDGEAKLPPADGIAG